MPAHAREASSSHKNTMPQMEPARSRMLRMRLERDGLGQLVGRQRVRLRGSGGRGCGGCRWGCGILGGKGNRNHGGKQDCRAKHPSQTTAKSHKNCPPCGVSATNEPALRQSSIEMLLPENLSTNPHNPSGCAQRRPVTLSIFALTVAVLTLLAVPSAARAQQAGPSQQASRAHAAADTPVLLDAMNAELHRAFTSLNQVRDAGG